MRLQHFCYINVHEINNIQYTNGSMNLIRQKLILEYAIFLLNIRGIKQTFVENALHFLHKSRFFCKTLLSALFVTINVLQQARTCYNVFDNHFKQLRHATSSVKQVQMYCPSFFSQLHIDLSLFDIFELFNILIIIYGLRQTILHLRVKVLHASLIIFSNQFVCDKKDTCGIS